MNINEKSEPVNKTPFNFPPKQQISKKSGGFPYDISVKIIIFFKEQTK